MHGHELLHQNVIAFLQNSLNSNAFEIYQLAGDASARKYYRIIHDQNTYVLMVWEPFQAEKYPFLNVLNHFQKNQIQVPTVIAVSEILGVILLEDLGDLTLERKFWENSNQESSWPFYQMALDQIIKIHEEATLSPLPTIAKEIEFDVAKYTWELNYAKENLIEGVLKHSLSEKTASELKNIFHDISEKLYSEPKVICHRDYHSRNLMIKLNKMYLIDFQDARLGPSQYDLVSLVKDSYVDISDTYADKLIQYYLEQRNFIENYKQSKDQFYYIYELQSVQRCFKACGSFASFMNQRQDKRYLKYLTGTVKKVFRSLGHFPEYKLLSDLLIDSGALEKNYERL